jgi:Ca2+-binding RTX toxin-like protein
MAIFTVQPDIKSNMAIFNLRILNFFGETETSFNASGFVYDNTEGFVMRIQGFGLTYTEANGDLTSVTDGSLSGFTSSFDNLAQVSITAWNIAAQPFFAAYFAQDWKKCMDLALDGDDQIFGSYKADSLRGGKGADDLIGLLGHDKIDGEDGNDVLGGGFGNDTLKGGKGIDFFVFESPLDEDFNVDTIEDFSKDREKLVLQDAVFTTIGPLGDLAKGRFVNGAVAQDGNDRILYNRATSEVFYDADGDGGGAAVLFAEVADGFRLNAGDFSII